MRPATAAPSREHIRAGRGARRRHRRRLNIRPVRPAPATTAYGAGTGPGPAENHEPAATGGPPGHGARAGGLLDSGREVPAVPDNIVLIMRFHPVGGEDVTVVSEDFGGEREALEAIAQAKDDRRSLVLTQARYGREAGHSGVIINLANVVAVRVSKTDSAATGQYM